MSKLSTLCAHMGWGEHARCTMRRVGGSVAARRFLLPGATVFAVSITACYSQWAKRVRATPGTKQVGEAANELNNLLWGRSGVCLAR